MADATQPFNNNPYSVFDPSQFGNPYSAFKGRALPWPSQYAGVPTDAYGRPIQSFLDAQQAHDAWQPPAPAAAPAQGMTLNSLNPAALAQNYLQSGQLSAQNIIDARQNPNAMAAAAAQQDPSDRALVANWLGPTEQSKADMGIASTLDPPRQQQAAPAAPTNPIDMSAAYLQALANPGPLKPVGATVPQSSTAFQPGSGVLQQFLANWQPASGPGSGFAQNFSKALRGK
jgi:hypothetical protein